MWRFICCALLYLGFVATQSSLYSTSFAYHDGAPQTFQVPSGIKDGTLFVQLQGAAGGDTGGGLGGFISVSFDVVANQLITIDIGQMGNINGTDFGSTFRHTHLLLLIQSPLLSSPPPPFNDHQVNPLMVAVALVLMWTLNTSMLVLVVA